jgi:glucokinase
MINPGVVSDQVATEPHAPVVGLLADIGGTNIRLAIAEQGASHSVRNIAKYECRNFASALDAIAFYLKENGLTERPTAAVVAAAGPVVDGEVTLTNLNWSLSEDDLRGAGFVLGHVFNDYVALALAAPLLDSREAVAINGPAAAGEPGTIAVVGAGTGFGVSALARDAFGEATLSTEGGHVSFAPVDDLEIEILRRLSTRHDGRVSVERILCGEGLCELHEILGEIDGEPAQADDSKVVVSAANAGDPRALKTVNAFCAVLGSVAGDVALTVGATGGVFLAGGLTRGMEPFLPTSAFRERFEAKGRFRGYMSGIPTKLMVRSHVGLLGAGRALQRLVASKANFK